MGQFSFMGYPCPQCSTCSYYEFQEFRPDGTKWAIPHSCTNQTTRSNAYELYGKNECKYSYGTTKPCQAYVSKSGSSSGGSGNIVTNIISSAALGGIIGAGVGAIAPLLGKGGVVPGTIIFMAIFGVIIGITKMKVSAVFDYDKGALFGLIDGAINGACLGALIGATEPSGIDFATTFFSIGLFAVICAIVGAIIRAIMKAVR